VKRTPLKRGKPLERRAPLRRTGFGLRGDSPRRSKPMKRGNGFAASTAQRVKVRELSCVVCADPNEKCDPAHLIPRTATSVGQEDPLAVVPLCRAHHREFDEGLLSLLEYLEPRYRLEVAFAVERVGLITALRRITNSRWTCEGFE
jgi:hypothetical protein